MSKWPWSTDDGIYNGFAVDFDARRYVAEQSLNYHGDRHVLTFGPNGSGKSMRLIYENLIRLPNWSVLVIDPKGELAAKTGSYREQYGDVYYCNPYRLNGLPDSGFNPVDTLDPTQQDFVDHALGLAEAMIRVEGKEPHWSASAQDLVTALFMYAALQENEKLCQLAFIRECIGKPSLDFRDVVQDMMKTGIERDWEELTIKAGRFMDIDPENKELNGILSTALTQTRWLDSRPIKDSTSKGYIDFGQMKHRPMTIYLMLPANRLASQAVWLRLMITCCLQKLITDTASGGVPVVLMLDEFANLGHLPIIENTMAMMRGYGVKLWSVFQDLSQLKAVYGERWESFVANSGVIQAFAPQDTVTADYLSKLSGQMTGTSHSRSASFGKEFGGSTSTGQFARPLLWPSDLRNLPDGHLMVYSHKLRSPMMTYAPFPDPQLQIAHQPRLLA